MEHSVGVQRENICVNTGYPAFVFGLPEVQAHWLQLSGNFFPVHFYSESRKLPPEINFDFSPPRYLVTTLPESEFEGQEQDIPFWHKYLVPVPFNF